ncbi:hypothetical protein KJ742_06325 [Patescibacteria group bacterium]|nr:hypothetical protein [Patescibacteria group bacterium]MBU1683527.1 hypothetical protein [Patescibacteria group bacterium]MBU1935021.1 hypothetical protein [Patescibacteria group bacterium]
MDAKKIQERLKSRVLETRAREYDLDDGDRWTRELTAKFHSSLVVEFRGKIYLLAEYDSDKFKENYPLLLRVETFLDRNNVVRCRVLEILN